MACLTQQVGGSLRCPSVSKLTRRNNKYTFNSGYRRPKLDVRVHWLKDGPRVVATAETKKREQLAQLLIDATERCRVEPTDGVEFTMEEFHKVIDKFHFEADVGSTVRGTVYHVDASGVEVEVPGKFTATLPLEEISIYKLKHPGEVGIYPGFTDDFFIVEEDSYEYEDTILLSMRTVQYDLAWERCRQLQAEDVVVTGKVVDANKGGIVALVEGLRGFIPFSQISSKSEAEELFGKELPLKFVELDQEQSRLVLSNRKAMADSQAQLGIGTVVTGTVQSLKPYGAFIDIGGINGLLHVSQISHDRVADISTVLSPGDTLKVMILSHDRERGRVSLSTKKLEPTPGDMIRNPTLVFEKAEEMAKTFRQRIAQAEAMARQDMLRFQPQSGLTLSADGILGPLSSELPVDGLDLSDIPPAEDF